MTSDEVGETKYEKDFDYLTSGTGGMPYGSTNVGKVVNVCHLRKG